MASKYEISAVFSMIDNLTAPVKRMQTATELATKQIQADMAKTKMQIKAVGDAMATAGKLALAAGVAIAGKTVVDSVKTYIDFENAVTKAGTKFKDLDVTSADYAQTLEQLQTAAREVGAATQFSATDAAGALDKMAMAGLTSKQSMAMLMGTTNLAVAAGIDLTSAVDMATDAMGAFNLMTDDKGNPLDEKGISDSMNRIADVVAKTTNMANLDMNMWFESVKMGAPTFTSLGGTIEEFSAAAGTLANAGIKGSIAGNALKNVMLRLSAPATEGAKAIQELGISVFDNDGKMRPFLDLMKQFETNLAGMADEKKAALLKDIFGAETIGSFNVLLSAGTESLTQFTNTLVDAGGTAETMAQAQMTSFHGLIEQLKSAFQDKQLSLGKAFEIGGAKEALQGLISWVQNVDVSKIAGFLTQCMQELPAIIENVGSLISFLWNIKDVIAAVVIGMTAYKAVMVAMVAIQAIRTAALIAETAATTGATAAQTAFNLALSLNPIGIVIAAIVALGLGIYELVKHWDSVSAAMGVVWQWMKNVASIIWDSVVGAFNKIIEVVQTAWQMFTSFGQAITNIMKKVASSILNFLLTPLIKVLDMLSGIPGVGDWIGGKADALRSFQKSLETNVTASVQQNTNKLGSDFNYYKSLGWDDDEIPPVTQGERTAYSVSENNNNTQTEVTVTLDKGLKGSVSGPAPNVTVQTARSGAW